MAPLKNEEKLAEVLRKAYETSNALIEEGKDFTGGNSEMNKAARELAKLKHAARGAALTLLAYKLVMPQQDIRAHKDEHPDGFAGRSYDSKVTVPFLIEHTLPRSVESHWLTQTLSFAGPFLPGSVLKTTPKNAGPLLVEVVNHGQNATSDEVESMVGAIVYELIKIRNADKVVLTRPKNLSIDKVKQLVNAHFARKYKSSAPRLPQLAIYAVYQAMMPSIGRYEDQKLTRLERLKSADRKKGTVGDIVVEEAGKPVEAVEIKFGKPIASIDVKEAIDKVRAESVRRYYLLSTAGIDASEVVEIEKLKADFLEKNGCEIIVNGVVDSIGYYLRLLSETSGFLSAYAKLVEEDEDTSYEHRIAWNECCESL